MRIAQVFDGEVVSREAARDVRLDDAPGPSRDGERQRTAQCSGNGGRLREIGHLGGTRDVRDRGKDLLLDERTHEHRLA